jgi:hypothetical protein
VPLEDDVRLSGEQPARTIRVREDGELRRGRLCRCRIAGLPGSVYLTCWVCLLREDTPCREQAENECGACGLAGDVEHQAGSGKTVTGHCEQSVKGPP